MMTGVVLLLLPLGVQPGTRRPRRSFPYAGHERINKSLLPPVTQARVKLRRARAPDRLRRRSRNLMACLIGLKRLALDRWAGHSPKRCRVSATGADRRAGPMFAPRSRSGSMVAGYLEGNLKMCCPGCVFRTAGLGRPRSLAGRRRPCSLTPGIPHDQGLGSSHARRISQRVCVIAIVVHLSIRNELVTGL